MRPSSVRAWTLLMFTLLHTLPFLRGVKRFA